MVPASVGYCKRHVLSQSLRIQFVASVERPTAWRTRLILSGVSGSCRSPPVLIATDGPRTVRLQSATRLYKSGCVRQSSASWRRVPPPPSWRKWDDARPARDPEDEMFTTDAHALESILRRINDPASGRSVAARWASAVGGKPGDAEFGRRHAQVFSLYHSVTQYVRSLNTTAQQRYAAASLAWWDAIVTPNTSWNLGNVTGPLIADDHINLLGSLGDAMELRLASTSAAPSSLDLADLVAQCDGWIESLPSSGIAPQMQQLLANGLEHVKWLVTHVETFGTARITQEAQTVTGSLVVAGEVLTGEARRNWTDRFKAWAGALVVVAGLGATTSGAIASGTEVIRQIETAVTELTNGIDSHDSSAEAPAASSPDQ